MLGAIWGHLGVPPNLGAKWPPCVYQDRSLGFRNKRQRVFFNLKCFWPKNVPLEFGQTAESIKRNISSQSFEKPV